MKHDLGPLLLVDTIVANQWLIECWNCVFPGRWYISITNTNLCTLANLGPTSTYVNKSRNRVINHDFSQNCWYFFHFLVMHSNFIKKIYPIIKLILLTNSNKTFVHQICHTILTNYWRKIDDNKCRLDAFGDIAMYQYPLPQDDHRGFMLGRLTSRHC